MNAKLRNVDDGTEAEWLEACDGGARRTRRGEVYWPFGVREDWSAWLSYYRITHLPSGYLVRAVRRRRDAVALVDQLRALDVNWQFTKPSGPRWKSTCQMAAPIAKRYKDALL